MKKKRKEKGEKIAGKKKKRRRKSPRRLGRVTLRYGEAPGCLPGDGTSLLRRVRLSHHRAPLSLLPQGPRTAAALCWLWLRRGAEGGGGGAARNCAGLRGGLGEGGGGGRRGGSPVAAPFPGAAPSASGRRCPRLRSPSISRRV